MQFYPYSVGYAESSGTVAETFTALGTTPGPSFTPPAGTYTSDRQVTFGDSNSGALVYFTTDGSTPVPGVSAELPAGFALSVDSSETISAIAVASGYSPSNVVSAAYTINIVPDFTLTATSLSVSAEESASMIVTINGVNGFNGTVSLACAFPLCLLNGCGGGSNPSPTPPPTASTSTVNITGTSGS